MPIPDSKIDHAVRQHLTALQNRIPDEQLKRGLIRLLDKVEESEGSSRRFAPWSFAAGSAIGALAVGITSMVLISWEIFSVQPIKIPEAPGPLEVAEVPTTLNDEPSVLADVPVELLRAAVASPDQVIVTDVPEMAASELVRQLVGIASLTITGSAGNYRVAITPNRGDEQRVTDVLESMDIEVPTNQGVAVIEFRPVEKEATPQLENS